ncbi:DUF4139 domain-containing protein [Azospirillaceae bacterium]
MARKHKIAMPIITASLVAAGSAAAADELALRRVMLSTGGVGYFEYEAKVSGDAALNLEVRLDRVDDIMKSIVVYDDKGGVGAINLPGREPLRETFREMPFRQEALESPVALFNALRGAEVRAVGNREISGRIISVTPDQVSLPNNGGTITRHRVSLMTADGIRQLILEDADALHFKDPRLQMQIETALAALARHGERDRRRLTIHTSGQGERTVRVAYVIEAPLWKTSYRLTLPDANAAETEAKDGALQGWAVLENLSGEAWKDVELTVVSGNPVTFRQALYSTYYVSRPEVPVEIIGRVLPGVDKGAMPTPSVQVSEEKSERRSGGARGLALGLDAMAEAAPTATASFPSPIATMMTKAVAAAPPPPRMADVAAAESKEATTQVVFRYPTPVSVAGGESLLLPIVSRPIPATRIALYQPATHPRHPLASVRLANDGKTGLPPGILTLYERAADGVVSYVGDAQMAAFPAGEERMLSFAVDQKVQIDRSETNAQKLSHAKIIDGALFLTNVDRAVTSYSINGAARENRTVIIEHPRYSGWTLAPVEGDSKPEMTASAYRLRREIPAGKTIHFEVAQERPREERLELVSLDASRIQYYAAAKEFSPDFREAFTKLSNLHASVERAERATSTLEEEQQSIESDQERLRQNITVAPRESDLYKRYLAKLGKTEDRLEALKGEIAKTKAEVAAAQRAMTEYAKGLKL